MDSNFEKKKQADQKNRDGGWVQIPTGLYLGFDN